MSNYPASRRPSRAVTIWLAVVIAMIAGIVLVGGLTRLTDSGLSITEWKPVTGVVPPLSEADWQAELEKYRSTTEYQVQNKGMTLEAFKAIFWWEWGHRLLARAIGLVVLFPLLWFWWRGSASRATLRSGAILFGLVCAQGALGWVMVVSGLVGRLDVSQYRLAAHLGLAFAIFAWALTMLLQHMRGPLPAPRPERRLPGALVWLVFLQVLLGALVAGLDAGLTYNTWPLMDGALVPSGLMAEQPWWLNFGENVAMVQFQHRMVAYAVAVLALAVAGLAAMRGQAKASAFFLVAVVIAQITLGVLTLLGGAEGVQPVALGAMHQLGALALLAAALIHYRLAGESAAIRFAAPAKTGFTSPQ
ncbi:MAG: COX15/CtaA family protein [Alphaproteobacteria bacterium]|nr:COX15/CtaA family protein [Alphaproteobacteria bacterium]